MNLDKSLNVFFCLDSNYLIHFTVTLTSLLENNKDLDISVYIIHDLEDTKLLETSIIFFNKKYKVKINIIKTDDSLFNNFHISLYISKAAYFRLLFAKIIPSNVLSGLYIDCDTVVTGSLKDLTALSFNRDPECDEYSILAVADKKENEDIARLETLGVKTSFYFNSGVMFMNLKKWRADNVTRDLIKIAKDYKENLKWWDQDVLNIYFINNCGRLNPTFNGFPEKKLDKMPVVIHFTGSSKPWHFFNNHPYKSVYWKYLKLTPFKNVEFEKITIKKVFKKYIGVIKS